jgi:hypothetical protein
MTAPAWALKLGAVVLTAATLGGSYQYATSHVKNPFAPLQPPVADRPRPAVEPDAEAAAAPSPEPTPMVRQSPTLTVGPASPTVRPIGSSRPTLAVIVTPTQPAPRTPTPTLAPSVRVTKLPPITSTHSS